MFREDILSSPRYWLLSNDTARMLFYHLGLRADDLGIFRAANYTIRQECFGADNKPTPEALKSIMSELADADLIRLYEIDEIEYGFIPRWRQRVRIIKSRFPLPPELIRDNSINDVIQKMSDGWPTSVGHASGTRQADDGHTSVEEKRREEKRSELNKSLGNGPVDKSLTAQKRSSDKKWWKDISSIIETGERYGIHARPGEDRDSLYNRVRAAIKSWPPPKEAP
jgi:hypothetical protein